MPSLNLTPTLSFEFGFRMFMKQKLDQKQTLVVLGLLVLFPCGGIVVT